MEDIKITFGKRIKQLRFLSDMTQQELAEAADMSISFLGNIERGNKSPTVETLQKLATAFNISLSELMSFDISTKTIEDQKTVQLRSLLYEYADKIEKLYK